MRGLWRDKDFLLAAGCLVVGILQIRSQHKTLRSLEHRAALQAAATPRRHRTHVPMTYDHPTLAEELRTAPLAAAFGMN